jgi:hypothetical protein
VRQPRCITLPGALALLAAAAPLSGQQKVSLTKPDAQTTESFTRISSLRELPSGKVLLADTQDKVVQLVDLAAGSVTKVGREGNGPGEYAFPSTLIGLPDGTTLLHDLLNRRFLSIAADGKPGAIVEMPRPPAPAGGPGGGPVILGGITQIRGYDALGRIYFQGSPFSATGGTADSVALLRWDRVKPTFDTVGYLKLPPNSAQRTQSGGNIQVRIGNNVRFTPTETWGVAGDGRVARVFPAPYRVAWLDSGKLTPGPVIPYTPMKVTEADKKEVLEQQRRAPPTTIMIGGSGGGTARSGTPPNFQPPPPEFAETKPPFDGQGAVVVAPEGEVWVLRTRPAGDRIPTYDVFDRTGGLIRKVSLNPDSRVIGFGKGTVYVARSDEDDLQYLERYKKP